MQNDKPTVTRRDDIDLLYGQELYLNGRKRIIDGVYKMGVKFRQARETIHIAIEMIDQYYLSISQEMTAKAFKVKLMHPQAVILHQVTVLLISSKFDEIDDNITAIRDLREYVYKQVAQQSRRDNQLVPTFNQIVECERKLMVFFHWNLKFILPLHILRAFLANGVLFSNEFNQMKQANKSQQVISKLKSEWSRSITTEALSISDLIVSKGNVSYRSESSSDIAAAIVYLSRKNILEADSPTGQCQVPQIWPQELVMITRCTEKYAKRILVEVLRPVEAVHEKQDTTKLLKNSAQATYNSLSKLDNAVLKYHNSIMSPNSQNQLTAQNLTQGPLTARAPKVPGSMVKATSDGRVFEKKAVYNGQLSAQQLLTSSQRVLSQTRMQQCISSEQMLKQQSNFLEENLMSSHKIERTSADELPSQLPVGRSFRAQTLKNNIKSSVEMLDKGMKEKEVLVEAPGKQGTQSFFESSGAASKAQSQRHLFLPSNPLAQQHQLQAFSQESVQTRQINQQIKEQVGSSYHPMSVLSDETDSVYGAPMNPNKPMNAQQHMLPQILKTSTGKATCVVSCEKALENSHPCVSEKTISMGQSTHFKNHCNGDIDQNAYKQWCPSATSPATYTQGPISSSRRPKNEIGFTEGDDEEGAEPIMMSSVDEAPCEEKLVHQAPQQQPVHPKAHLEDGIKLSKPTPTQIKSKKTLPKSKYLEVKRAQIARNETNRKIITKEKKNSQNKLVLPGDQQVQSPTEALRIFDTLPQTTKNQSIISMPSHKTTFVRRATSNTNITGMPTSATEQQPQEARPSVISKQLSSTSNVSNEYFSVRPKMIKHCNLLTANQNDIIRSSSIEYESHITNHSDHSSAINSALGQQVASEYTTKQSQRRRPRVPSQQKVQPGQQMIHSQGAGGQSTTVSNTTFFKRNQNEQQIRPMKMIGPHSTKNTNRQPPSGGFHLVSDPAEIVGNSGYQTNIDQSIGSSIRDQAGSRMTSQMLPKIETKPTSAQTSKQLQHSKNSIQSASQNFDFSHAVDRFSSNKQSVQAGKGIASQKYSHKASIDTIQAQRTRLDSAECQRELTKTHQSASMRQMRERQDFNTEENVNMQNQPLNGMHKTKSSIFGGKTNSSTATKSINGFGSAANAAPSPAQSYSQKVFTVNQIKKGPSFQQMQQIVTPTQMMETQMSSQANKLNSKHQDFKDRKLSSQNSAYNNVASNFKSNLIPTQRLNRSGSSRKTTINTNSQLSMSSQILGSTQRFLHNGSMVGNKGQGGSNTLKQVAADEAMANLKQHSSINQKAAQAAQSNTASTRQTQGNGKFREGSAKRTKLSQVSQNALPSQLNATGNRNHSNLGHSSITSSKKLGVEQNKQSSFLAVQQQVQAKQLQSGRSYENIQMLNKGAQDEMASINSLRLRHLKSTQAHHQDSKH